MADISASHWWPRQFGATLRALLTLDDKITSTRDMYVAAGNILLPVINEQALEAGIRLKMPTDSPPIVPTRKVGSGTFDAEVVITFLVPEELQKGGRAFDWLEKLRDCLELQGIRVTSLTTTVHVS